MQLGIDRLISQPDIQKPLLGKKLALVAHPASVSETLQHSIDALVEHTSLTISAAFGPQHGMRGEKQDNMVETDNYIEPQHQIPVYSLYGEVRRPTDEMMQSFDVLLFDIQDVGCRIYTYATTLLYLLEACERHDKEIWILDRPNPAGRAVEGNLLQPGWESFVGATEMVMRHGLSMGELAKWFIINNKLDVNLNVISMLDYDPTLSPGYGWPSGGLSWVNPSPNASSINMARFYSGSVLLEGTHLSEGRGTTVPLEIVGAPDIDIQIMLQKMHQSAPEWMQGADIRPCFFQPTFHKHQDQLCQGFQIHTDNPRYNPNTFKPFRLTVLFLKAIKQIYPDYVLWRDFPYEYENDKLAFDVINGGTLIREWIEDSEATTDDLEKRLSLDEQQWQESISDILLYPA